MGFDKILEQNGHGIDDSEFTYPMSYEDPLPTARFPQGIISSPHPYTAPEPGMIFYLLLVVNEVLNPILPRYFNLDV